MKDRQIGRYFYSGINLLVVLFIFIGSVCAANAQTIELTGKLKQYYNISDADIPSQDLEEYVNQNKSAIMFMTAQYEYGSHIQKFMLGQTNRVECPDYYMDALDYLDAVGLEKLSTIIRVFKTWHSWDMNSLASVEDVLDCLGPFVNSAISPTWFFDAFESQLSAVPTRFLFGEYFSARISGVSPSDAYANLNDFSVYLDYLSQLKEVSPQNLPIWFETAYQSYRIVGYSDSLSLRNAYGDAIIALLKPVEPVISQENLSAPAGTTFTQTGSGFFINGTATLHFYKPDGSEYPTQTVNLSDTGSFNISYASPLNKEPGVYTWKAVDDATGKESNSISYCSCSCSGISIYL